jgi:hypothetical protein
MTRLRRYTALQIANVVAERDHLLTLNAELLAALDDLLPYARAAIGLPETSWPPDSVILKARAVLAKAKGEA